MTASEEVAMQITPGPNAVDITPKQDGGVLKEIIKEGEGDAVPASGCTVTVHYEGKLTNGTVFDSSKSRNPFEFTLGRENVIKGWEIGISTMKKGEVAILTCKPEYAYGNSEQKDIPPGSTLIFEITVIQWTGADLTPNYDGGIIKLKTLKNGKGYSSPLDGAVVEVHIVGKYEDKILEDRDIKFNLGEGCEVGVVDGVEIALTSFKKGEKSVLQIKPKYAFKEEGDAELGVPSNATVEYTVELKNFEQPAKSWDITAEARVEQAKLLKEKATNYFKANKYKMAAKFYEKILDYVNPESGFANETEFAEEKKTLHLAAVLNLGLTHLKLNQYYEAKQYCDQALELDSNNVKGYFRRGQAYLSMGEPEKAKGDFEVVLRLEPSNKLAASQIVACCNKIKQQREKDKKIYANMFEKFARKDKEDGTTRFGWWDDEKKEPVITDVEPVDIESIEEAKSEKKKQLDNLKRVTKARKEQMQLEEEMAKPGNEAKKGEEEEAKVVETEENK